MIKKNYLWILCTKWFTQIPKPIVLTEKERKGAKPPKKKLEYDYIPFWTPVGIHAGVPYCWNSQREVMNALKEIAEIRPSIQKLLTVACQVKYVPGKIKKYNKYWYDKYVIKEVPLKLEKIKDRGETEFYDSGKINIGN